MNITKRQRELHDELKVLHHQLRDATYEKYRRINPFCEDLFDWKERGHFWGGAEKNITIYNSTTIVGEVDIGDNTWIGPFCSLDGNGGLKIGSFCSISAGVQLLTHDTVKWALSGGLAEYEYAPVVIGNNCFVGTHAIVLKGVTVGDQCIIGAGAVVTKNVPSRSIVAGVPAKIIGHVVVDKKNRIDFKWLKREHD